MIIFSQCSSVQTPTPCNLSFHFPSVLSTQTSVIELKYASVTSALLLLLAFLVASVKFTLLIANPALFLKSTTYSFSNCTSSLVPIPCQDTYVSKS